MRERSNIGEHGTRVMLLALATLLTRAARAEGARLLVFVHASVKQRALQSQLQSALPGINVTAVGRLSDFERTLREGTDAILALPVVIESFEFPIAIRGYRGGSSEEAYTLVATGATPNPNQVASVGALDLLGREGTRNFVRNLLGHSCRVERVSKVEDLLPLLQMQRVEAIVLPARLLPEIRSTSKLELVGFELPNKVGLPAAACATAVGSQVMIALGKLPGGVLRILGVDSWR